ncbi:hypothetical protein [Citrobacter portucalensis]|uniref:hypothetical protein n=1 Tax=Citrobacter portucalensis TaxID=1639133 RepID=UPI000C2248B5|nr:hypothetical protein [Citrobacter portucalensis]ATX90546.1 hypothetical protein AM348_02230 [Citrobacter freundii]AVD76921.1 hypothetical protein AM350_04030 [Citrobacter freundii]
MEIKKSILIFCEGPHDVALIHIILRKLFEANDFQGKFNQLPAPFNTMFQTAIANHAELDLSIDMAHKFFLPDKILIKDDIYIILFNAGGSNRGARIKPFIAQLWSQTAYADIFPGDATSIVREHKYIFISDADYRTHQEILEEISQDFSEIQNKQWITNSWESAEDSFISVNVGQRAVAALVWCNRTTRTGTLEDILMECIGENAQFKSSLKIISELYSWDTNNSNIQRSVAEKARMYKASISLMGQREKPGSSMNVIVGQAKIIDRSNLTNSRTVTELVDFIRDFC